MYGEPVHLSLGSCRYAGFNPGDVVELSQSGWGAGLAVNYAYTFGKVVQFENGILSVLREGMSSPQEFHPCFWEKITEEYVEELRKFEHENFWLDHVPNDIDDLQLHEV